MAEMAIVFGTLLLALVLFATGKIRYDIVALIALLIVTIAGIIDPMDAFLGFGHPAVITVAAVLIVSRGLQNSGLIDILSRWVGRVGDGEVKQIFSMTGIVAVLSAFMNNVGALALMMPVAIRTARKNGRSPSFLLMPVAFGSLLGGMITLIGTPPNIIIATYRVQNGADPFLIFDFAYVGIGVAICGILFISLVGWRLIPMRESPASTDELFSVKNYLTEVKVPEGCKLSGKMIADIGAVSEAEVMVVGVIRSGRRIVAPSSYERILDEDILIIRADSDDLQTLIDATGFELAGKADVSEEVIGSDSVGIIEAIVKPDSPIIDNTAYSANLRWIHGINLLAVAREGSRIRERLNQIRFRAGDILLLQGKKDAMAASLPALGCLPLAEREIRIGAPKWILLAIAIFGSALLVSALGILPVQVTFSAAVVLMILTSIISLREAYASVEWPIIILLGAMIPVGQALETSGGAQLIAESIVIGSSMFPPWMTLTLLLVITMFLSDLVNNAAAAVLMAPIAIGIALDFGASIDPFLMAVAIGASCAFLTPIGHQSNTLVMGPGGYRFTDYWRMGIVLEMIIVIVSIPLLLIFWPMY
ncbi:potassium transporter TrkA [Methanocalculus chunghsingensis]|uniref:Potassium transporter TrkA n=1 Tax=Methanocalculus chunghsingensis TaxID=156457 RepID=A0A8J7W7F6_9EURY|nr:SLC13 family permease [Methanocalculus chunghsingensis]MBR1367995.1 potassium transporter TrkA [Methanocalculus chunghsingensis]